MKKYINIHVILSFLVVSLVIVGIISCKDSLLETQINNEVIVQNGILEFKDIDSYRKTIEELEKTSMNEFTQSEKLDKWEKNLGFKSWRRTIVEKGEETPYEMPDSFTATTLNPDGLVKIGGELWHITFEFTTKINEDGRKEKHNNIDSKENIEFQNPNSKISGCTSSLAKTLSRTETWRCQDKGAKRYFEGNIDISKSFFTGSITAKASIQYYQETYDRCIVTKGAVRANAPQMGARGNYTLADSQQTFWVTKENVSSGTVTMIDGKKGCLSAFRCYLFVIQDNLRYDSSLTSF